MVPRIVGPPELAGSIQEQLLHTAPRDAGRKTRLLASDAVKQTLRGGPDDGPDDGPENAIALASYNQDDESDLALSSAARASGIDFILRGEILPDRRPRAMSEAGNRLIVSWRLMPVRPELQLDLENRPTGLPVVVEWEDALKRYPDLAFATDKESALKMALVRDTLPLITPSVQRGRVQLEIPYLVPGSRAIRRGNALAVAGRWSEAEALWRGVHERYPFSSVAVHNLAVAAVAKQDFSEARRLARKAVRMKPIKLHQQTLVWVERTQRAYHQAFDLPDPPEGWSVTR